MTELPKFAAMLEDLVLFQPRTKSDLEGWDQQAAELKQWVEQSKLPVPHFFWHYIADADIRMKDEFEPVAPEYLDKTYSASHNRRIRLLLDQVKRGVMPGWDEI